MSESEKQDLTPDSLAEEAIEKAETAAPAEETAPVEESAPVEEDAPTEETVSVQEPASEDAPEPEEEKPAREKERPVHTAFDFVELFVLTLTAVLVLTSFFFRHSVVDGSSMSNTLQNGEHMIISDFLYTPKAGDIVVLEDYSLENSYYRKPLVKRVIATEGQTVLLNSASEIYVDGVAVDSSYALFSGHDSYSYPISLTVGEGEVFVLGDNRYNSADSRAFGCVDEDAILGKVLLRVYPFSVFGTVD